MQIANFEKRVFSYLVDYAITLGISIGIFFLLDYFFPQLVLYHGIIIVSFCSSILYSFGLGAIVYFTNGNSIGNVIFGIRMVSLKFHKLSYRQVLLKYIPLSLFPCVLINAIYMLIKHTEKTIFDELSHTVSISIR